MGGWSFNFSDNWLQNSTSNSTNTSNMTNTSNTTNTHIADAIQSDWDVIETVFGNIDLNKAIDTLKDKNKRNIKEENRRKEIIRIFFKTLSKPWVKIILTTKKWPNNDPIYVDRSSKLILRNPNKSDKELSAHLFISILEGACGLAQYGWSSIPWNILLKNIFETHLKMKIEYRDQTPYKKY